MSTHTHGVTRMAPQPLMPSLATPGCQALQAAPRLGWGGYERCLPSLLKMLHKPGFEVQECRYTGQFVKKLVLSVVTVSPLMAEF